MKKSILIRLIVCAALLSILLPVGFATGIFRWEEFTGLNWNINTLWSLLIMIAGVFLATVLKKLAEQLVSGSACPIRRTTAHAPSCPSSQA